MTRLRQRFNAWFWRVFSECPPRPRAWWEGENLQQRMQQLALTLSDSDLLIAYYEATGEIASVFWGEFYERLTSGRWDLGKEE